MEARGQKFDRLLGALDELITLEALTLKAGDYAAVGEIQRRVQPVLTTVVNLGGDCADRLVRARVAGLLARRQHSIEFIETQLETARAELAAVQESASRMAKIAPAYGRSESVGRAPRFSAAG